MPPGVPGAPGMPATGGGAKHDPTRSLYVVVPYTNDISKMVSFYKKAPPGSQNPPWQPTINHAFGHANLMMDNSSIQLYLDLGPSAPKGVKTRQVELKDKRGKLGPTPDPQLLLDLTTAVSYTHLTLPTNREV